MFIAGRRKTTTCPHPPNPPTHAQPLQSSASYIRLATLRLATLRPAHAAQPARPPAELLRSGCAQPASDLHPCGLTCFAAGSNTYLMSDSRMGSSSGNSLSICTGRQQVDSTRLHAARAQRRQSGGTASKLCISGTAGKPQPGFNRSSSSGATPASCPGGCWSAAPR
jgi:hypothetical protein